jgi:pSer/pThr/pTyr-binding forkhead associated (FHA) protein
MASDVAESCPRCSEPRIGLFCEQCGHSYSVAAPPAPSTWCAVIAPDRDYFETGRADIDRFTFPASSPARRVTLTGASVRVGRRSGSRGTTPEIDLADPPADPGVSREHARLLAQPDGTWAVVDEGSTNGTYVNGGRQRIAAHQPVPLADGDRVHLGVWTTITLRRGS